MRLGLAKKLRYTGMISVIVGLIMANFFHAFLMNADPAAMASESGGACHTQENPGSEKKESSSKDLLPCCADNKNSSTAPLMALFEFNKTLHFSSPYFTALPSASGQASKPKNLQAPPSQIALDTIILRI